MIQNRNIDGAFKPLYQLNNQKGFKISGIRKKLLFFIKKLVFSIYFFPTFLFKFTFQAYERTNNTIYNIGNLEQTGKKNAVMLMKSNFFLYNFF